MKYIVYFTGVDIKSNMDESKHIKFLDYLLFIYHEYNLASHEFETVLPSKYMDDVNVIISKDKKDTWFEDNHEFMRACSLTTFEQILKRTIDKIFTDKCEEIIELIKNSEFLVNSEHILQIEVLFINAILKIPVRNVFDGNQLIINEMKPSGCENKQFLEEETAKIIISYLAVVVNLRDQLRFSYIFNVPERKLNHHAFTNLRHESIEKGLSMPQMAISYVTRLKLGSKSYAPAKDCSLNKYVYGLSDLVDFINKLQTIMEDQSMNNDKVGVVAKLIRSIASILLGDKLKRFSKKKVQYVKDKMLEVLQIVQSESKERYDPKRPLKIVQNLIRKLVSYYSIHYNEFTYLYNCDSPYTHKTPKGGCSRLISQLYMSPNTVDSPIAVAKSKITESIEPERESETMPSWPLHGKYQSDLTWMRDNMTPPAVVKKQSHESLLNNNRCPVKLPDFSNLTDDDDDLNDETQSQLLLSVSNTEKKLVNVEGKLNGKENILKNNKENVRNLKNKEKKITKKRKSTISTSVCSKDNKIKKQENKNQKLITQFFKS